jgi:hypothetical protein
MTYENEIKMVVVLFVAFVPLISYIDYHIFKKHLICSFCGKNEFNKHAFLLACTLECTTFILGMLLGILFLH